MRRFFSFPFFGKWRKKQFLLRLFLSTIAIAALILMPATLVNYSMFSRILKEEIKDNSVAIPRLMVGAFNSWHYSFMPYSTTLIQDAQVSRLIFGKDLSPIEKMRGLAALNLMQVSNPLIHSVYVYNYQTNRVFSTIRGEESPDNYSDPGLLKLIGPGIKARVFAYLPRTLSSPGNGSSQHGENVLSVIVGYPGITTGALKGGMVINLSETRLRLLLSDAGKQLGNAFFIIDQSGTYISHPDPKMFGMKAHETDPAYVALKQGTPEGGAVITASSAPILLSFATQPELGWVFVHTIQYESIAQRLITFRNRTFMAFFSLFVFALILSLLISRGLYKPIDSLVKDAGSLLQKKSEKKDLEDKSPTELQFLGASISMARENIRNLRQEHVLSILSDILAGNRDVSELQNSEDLPDLEIWEKGFRIILFRIDNVLAFRASLGSRAFLECMKELRELVEITLGKHNFVFEMSDDTIVAILPTSADKAFIDNEKLTLLLEMANKQFGCSFTTGISMEFHSIDDMPVAFSQAYNATKERFRSENEKIFQFENCKICDDASYPEDMDAEPLFRALKLGKKDAVAHYLDEILSKTMSGSFENFVRVVRRLVVQMEQVVHTCSVEIRQDLYDYIQSLEAFRAPETIKEVRAAFLAVFDRYYSLSEYDPSINYEAMAQRVDQEVSKRLADPNLCPNTLAADLNISTNYLRTIYKRTTGISLTDSIRDRRMHEACRLLIESDYPIKEVALMVGYSNYNYFFTGFRKMIGMTPLAFRESRKGKKPQG